MIKKKLKISLSFHFDKKVIYFLLKVALPFALIAIFSRVYGYVDSVLLSYLQGDRAIGLYSSAMKIPFALQFIPAAFAAAIFPAFSYYYIHDKEQLKNSFDKAMLFLTIVAVPLSFGIFAIADNVVGSLFGVEYIAAIPILKIMIFGLIFVFLNFPLGSLLNGCDRQLTNTKLVGLVMVINFILNLIFIPYFSYYASAVIFLLCHSFLFVCNLFVARQIIPYSRRNLFIMFAKTFGASIVMLAVLLFLSPMVHYLILIGIGAIIYLGIMYLIKGFTADDIKFLWRSFFKRATV